MKTVGYTIEKGKLKPLNKLSLLRELQKGLKDSASGRSSDGEKFLKDLIKKYKIQGHYSRRSMKDRDSRV